MTRPGLPDGKKDREALINGSDLINGTGLTNGFGMMNGLGLTNGSKSVKGSGPICGPHPVQEGLTNGKQVGKASGLETRADLINGLSIKPRGTLEDPPSGWGRSARKRRAVRKALLEKATVPMPSNESGS
jgi:hypothetical protein